jgi:hypothetical protein
MVSQIPLVVVLVALVALLAGCGPTASPGGGGLPLPDTTVVDQQQAPTKATFEATIGPTGGEATATSGPLQGFRLVFPADALTAETKIHCVEHEDVPHPLYGPAGAAAHCTPDDAPFEKMVQITLPYDDDKLPAGGASALSVLVQPPATEIEAVGEITVDLNAKTVTIEAWALGVLQAAKVAPTTGRGG